MSKPPLLGHRAAELLWQCTHIQNTVIAPHMRVNESPVNPQGLIQLAIWSLLSGLNVSTDGASCHLHMQVSLHRPGFLVSTLLCSSDINISNDGLHTLPGSWMACWVHPFTNQCKYIENGNTRSVITIITNFITGLAVATIIWHILED